MSIWMRIAFIFINIRLKQRKGNSVKYVVIAITCVLLLLSVFCLVMLSLAGLSLVEQHAAWIVWWLVSMCTVMCLLGNAASELWKWAGLEFDCRAVSFWCRLGLHRWSKWEIMERHVGPSPTREFLGIPPLRHQVRHCLQCNRVQEEIV